MDLILIFCAIYFAHNLYQFYKLTRVLKFEHIGWYFDIDTVLMKSLDIFKERNVFSTDQNEKKTNRPPDPVTGLESLGSSIGINWLYANRKTLPQKSLSHPPLYGANVIRKRPFLEVGGSTPAHNFNTVAN